MLPTKGLFWTVVLTDYRGELKMSSSVSDVFPGNRHGVLQVEAGMVDTYYKFLSGTDQNGETRQLVTRGPGKEKAGTRIPILVPQDLMSSAIEYAQRMQRDLKQRAWAVFHGWCLSQASMQDPCELLARLTVPLIKMPRAGNLLTGVEWNAPGGTGNVGESLEEISAREFDEEAGVAVVGIESPFPPGMLASGIYDEIQLLSFALITGNPTKLVEGGQGWHQIPLLRFRAWAVDQNQTELPDRWETDQYVPIDFKVVMALWWLTETMNIY
ncbi:MAG: hypothetical protein ABIP54_02635 [Candidatus Andersenbacteria bacterium]